MTVARRVELEVAAEEAGERLDRLLAERIEGWSRTALGRLIAAGHALVEGAVAPASRRVRAGERVVVVLEEPPATTLEAEPLPLDVIHEDEDLLAVNKPAGLVVHPGAGVRSGTLANALLHRLGEALRGVGPPPRPGIVHRLDKGTSGVLVVAKTAAAHAHLAAQFAARTVEKTYLALVLGVPGVASGRIDRPVGRDPARRTRMKAGEGRGARAALTEWRVGEAYGRSAALLEVRLHTGRTHQIRVHLAGLGHPVAGDDLYGGGRAASVRDGAIRAALAGLARPALHALRLVVTSPGTGRRLTFEAPIPADLAAVLAALRTRR